MKYIIAFGVVMCVLGFWFFQPSTVVYENAEPEVVEKTVEVSQLEKRIADAQAAKMEEIEAAAKQSYDETKARMLKEVELSVIETYQGELTDRAKNLEKDVADY